MKDFKHETMESKGIDRIVNEVMNNTKSSNIAWNIIHGAFYHLIVTVSPVNFLI